MKDYTTLQVVWFVLIGILWAGYFVLEGFDFGVGMLLRLLGRNRGERRALIHTIGPVWDGNEVWLIVAGGATFAAFPQWYATVFSGFYIALFLVLFALIARGVAFEFWGKRPDASWARTWELAISIGSFLVALLWGVAWANIIHGVPIDAHGNADGSLSTLLHPYGLLGGVTTVLLFLALGVCFLVLKTKGELLGRVARWSLPTAVAAATVGMAFLVWTIFDQPAQSGVEIGVTVLTMLLFAAFAGGQLVGRPGVAFALGALATIGLVAVFFVDLFPHVMVSTTNPAYSLTLNEAASSHYTLTVMTVITLLLLPLVLAYQSWTYWVFRRRIGAEDFPEDVHSPLDLIPS
jgi:cytochrome d ubiquinol oxidase subunit II